MLCIQTCTSSTELIRQIVREFRLLSQARFVEQRREALLMIAPYLAHFASTTVVQFC